MTEKQAVSVTFLTLAFAQLMHVFNMRDDGARLWRNTVTCNPYVWGALTLCTALLLAAVYLPGLATVLRVVDPGVRGWLLILTMGAMPGVAGQVFRVLARKA